METALILSQIIFYSVISLAIIVSGFLFSITTYHLLCATKELKEIIKDFHNFTNNAQERISDIIERLSELPIFSFLLKRKRNIMAEAKSRAKK